MHQIDQPLPTSDHFRLEPVAEGVYAALAIEGGGASSNAGIVDLGDRTLIFDTFETPRAAADLATAAEQLTGRPATYVVNSHAHADHWLGNQAFPPHVSIVATHTTREQMQEVAQNMQKLAKDPSELQTYVQQDQARLAATDDERERTALELSIARWRHVLAGLPTLAPRLPNHTFAGKLTFYGSGRRAELLAPGHGHTPGDCLLTLPEEKVAFTGDLAFFGRQPFMAHCDPDGWVVQLEALERSAIETFVPGHGPLGDKGDIALQKRYLTTLKALIAQAVEAGQTIEDLLQQPLTAPFDAWSPDGRPKEINVRFLYQRASGQNAG